MDLWLDSNCISLMAIGDRLVTGKQWHVTSSHILITIVAKVTKYFIYRGKWSPSGYCPQGVVIFEVLGMF